jgi:hypothetical protein
VFGKRSARSSLLAVGPRLAQHWFYDLGLLLAILRGHRLVPRRIIQRPGEMTGRAVPDATRWNESWWKA